MAVRVSKVHQWGDIPPVKLIRSSYKGSILSGIAWSICGGNPLTGAIAYFALKALSQSSFAQGIKNGSFLQHAENHNYRAMQLLLDFGCDINAQDEYGNTALIRAVEDNDLPLVEFLLSKGADPNVQNKRGFSALATCLHINVEGIDEKRLYIAALLMQNGANPSLRGFRNKTILDNVLDLIVDCELRGNNFRGNNFLPLHAQLVELAAELLQQNCAFMNPWESYSFQKMQCMTLKNAIMEKVAQKYKMIDLISLLEKGSNDPAYKACMEVLQAMKKIDMGNLLIKDVIRLAKAKNFKIYINVNSDECFVLNLALKGHNYNPFMCIAMNFKEGRYLIPSRKGNTIGSSPSDCNLFHELEHVRYFLQNLDQMDAETLWNGKGGVDSRWTSLEEQRTIELTNQYQIKRGIPVRKYHCYPDGNALEFLKNYKRSEDPTGDKIKSRLLNYMHYGLCKDVEILSQKMTQKEILDTFDAAEHAGVKIEGFSFAGIAS